MDMRNKKGTIGQHGQRFHHKKAHPEMPHTINFRLIQSNHGNPANAATMMTDDSSKWEAVPTNATK